MIIISICRIFEIIYDTHTTEPAKENGLAPGHFPEVAPMYDHHTYQFKTELFISIQFHCF